MDGVGGEYRSATSAKNSCALVMSFSAFGWRVAILRVVTCSCSFNSDRGVILIKMEKNAEKKIRGCWHSRTPITAVSLQSSQLLSRAPLRGVFIAIMSGEHGSICPFTPG